MKKPKGKDGKENEARNKKCGATRQPVERAHKALSLILKRVLKSTAEWFSKNPLSRQIAYLALKSVWDGAPSRLFPTKFEPGAQQNAWSYY